MRSAYNVYVEKPGGKNHLEDLGVDGKIISEWILKEVVWEDADWMHMAQDRDKWRALVNNIMIFAVNFLTS
jgi:hypothetical protein